MSIVINESPISSAIKAVPNALSAMMQAQHARDQQQWNRNQQLFERQMFMNEKGMAAGGYDNQTVLDFFNNLALSKGEIVSTPGGLDWTGTAGIPTLEQALASYKGILTAQGKKFHPTQDQALFTKLYNGLLNERAQRFTKEISKAKTKGFDDEDITSLIKYNGLFANNMNALINELDMNVYGKQIGEFQDLLPKRDMNILDRLDENPFGTAATVGIGTAGATGLWNFANASSSDILTDANTKYRDLIKGSREELKVSRNWLNEAKKSGNKTDMRIARKMVKDATKNVTTTSNEASRIRKQHIKSNTNFKRLMNNKYMKTLQSPTMRGLAPFMASALAEPVGEFIGGEKGGILAQATVGTAATMPLGKFIAQQIAKKLPSQAVKFLPIAAMDGPVPAGDIIAAGLSAGAGISIIWDAVGEWKRANRGQKKQ